MESTSPSLLQRLHRPEEKEAWPRFVQLYTPLLFHWTRKLGMQDQDANDLIQEVFVSLVQKLPTFQYQANKSFRAWLHTVLTNKWRDHLRKRTPVLNGIENLDQYPDSLNPDELDEKEYRSHLVAQALRLMKVEFPEKLWRACWEHVVNGKPAAQVAKELGIAEGTVYVAKSRVLHRLREELAGLLD